MDEKNFPKRTTSQHSGRKGRSLLSVFCRNTIRMDISIEISTKNIADPNVKEIWFSLVGLTNLELLKEKLSVKYSSIFKRSFDKRKKTARDYCQHFSEGRRE